MRVVSFTRQGRASFGLLRGDESGVSVAEVADLGGPRSATAATAGIVDLGARLGLVGLHELFGARGEGALSCLREYEHVAADMALADVALAKPLADWGKCFCVGVNYPERNAEYKDGSEAPQYPSLFVRFPESFVGPGEPLVRPPESAELDYEGEIVMVIGRAGRRIPESRWREHVFGWTLGNEGTIRDWVRHGKFNVTPGKNWAASGSIGPWIVPFDEVGEGPFELQTTVNGEERQRDSTARMTFPFGRIVEYISTFCTLAPGDVIFTGTPAGAGARMSPPRFLSDGDRVEVHCEKIGRLWNTVRDE